MNVRRTAEPQSSKPMWPILALLFLTACLLLSGCTIGRAAETVAPTATSPAAPQETQEMGASSPAAPSPTPLNGMPATPQPANNLNSNCTYTTYFWQSNPDRWLTDNILIGDSTYTKSDAAELLAQEAQDSSSMLLKEFLGAALNILKGADPAEVEADMTTASEWLSAHPPGYQISASEISRGLELAARLQAYNDGLSGPGLCADQPATPTPTPTLTPTITPTPTVTPIHPTATRRATATERIYIVQPTNPPASEEPVVTEPVNPEPVDPTPEPPKPTSAPTEAPPPPAEPPPPEPQPQPTENSQPAPPPANDTQPTSPAEPPP